MDFRKSYAQSLSNRQLTLLLVALSLPAFLYHLGMQAFIGDEGIRSLVAFEMFKSGNYIVPTLNGEPYYNKPPLFNWVILGVSMVFGKFGEWPARLTTLFFLGCYALTVYGFVRRHFDSQTALLSAFMLLTSGRILFWDSMLGLIDICFSWVVFVNFIVLYEMGRRTNGRWFWILSYGLCSVAFLLKGLPAAVFQIISVPAALWLHGRFREKWFSLEHLFVALAGSLPVFIYYGLYAYEVSLEKVFSVLLDQSMERTGTHHGLMKTVLHLFTFPFEQIYHFLPWSLLVAAIVHPRAWRMIHSNPVVRFMFWMLVVNLPVYWFSVQVFPRYLLMFVPLFNLAGLYLLQEWTREKPEWNKWVKGISALLIVAALLGVILMPLEERVRELPQVFWIWMFGVIGLSISLRAVWTDPERILLWLCVALLVIRIVFDGVIIPIRNSHDETQFCRQDCLRLSSRFGDRTWMIYDQTETHQVARFYTAVFSDQIIRKTRDSKRTDVLYLVDRQLYPDFRGVPLDSLLLESGHYLALMQIEKE